MSTQTAIVIGLAIYALLMLGMSLFWMLRVKKAADYLVAGRGLPYWVLTGTIVGTGIGTGVVIGGSGLAYRHGWAGCAYPIGLGIGTVVAGLMFAVMRRYRFMTLTEEIASYYGNNRVLVEISNLALFVSQVCWLAVQILGGGSVLGAVTEFPPAVCLVLSGLITAMISIPGGLKTVVYTDFVQAAILLCGFGTLAVVAMQDVGGLAGLREHVPAGHFSFLGVESAGWGWGKATSLIIVLIISVIADPSRRLTMYSSRSATGARWGMVSAGLIEIVFSVIVGITGMYAFTLNSALPAADQALPWLVMNVLPPWLAALVVVSIASAIFSSANGSAAAACTFFIRHVFPLVTGRYAKRPLVAVRRALVCAFVLSTALAMCAGTIVNFVCKFLPVTMGGLAVIILLGRFWRRATWQGALAALVVTPIVSLGVMAIPAGLGFWNEPIIPATLAGIVAQVIVSLLTPPNTRSFDDVAAEMTRQREAVEG
jgi:solute:Na+ symporter, SSS family